MLATNFRKSSLYGLVLAHAPISLYIFCYDYKETTVNFKLAVQCFWKWVFVQANHYTPIHSNLKCLALFGVLPISKTHGQLLYFQVGYSLQDVPC